MNLVEQQTVLRDLSDDMLQQAMQGGMAPPYLVLAEVNRRKDARERYVSQKAKYDADQATVAQETMDSLMKATAAAQQPSGPMGLEGAMGAQMPPGGLDAALGGGAPATPTEGGLDAAAPMEAMPAYAEGGMVSKYDEGGLLLPGGRMPSGGLWSGFPVPGAAPAAAPAAPPAQPPANFSFKYPTYKNPYSSLMDLYNSQLGDIEKQREQARAMALISAGTGMMQGGPNTLKNIGAAFGPAMQGYQTEIGSINQTQRDLMAGKINADIASQQAEKDAKASYEDSPEGRAEVAKQMGFEPGSDEYNSYVYLKTNPTLKPKYSKDGFQQGLDANSNPVDAIFNETSQQWETAGGMPVNGFRTYRPDEIAGMKNQPKERKAFETATVSLASYIDDHAFTSAKIDAAINLLDKNPNVAGWGSLLKLPEGEALQFDNMLSSIRSQQAFDTITALKQTGGGSTGLGPVAVTEFQALKDAVVAISSTNDPKVVKEQLLIIKDNYARLKQKVQQAYTAVNKTRVEQLPENDPMLEYINSYGLITDITGPNVPAPSSNGSTFVDVLAP